MRVHWLREVHTHLDLSLPVLILIIFGGQQADPDIIYPLHTDMEGILTKLSGISHRKDKLMPAKDSDLVFICDLNRKLKQYKCKYKQAKTGLRSVKAMFPSLAHW
jgi:hypothetical protein